ncbi:sodium:solute symporter family protein [Haladaptatus halobius]|uniref:sodium:solute symporter family protein n=1 Tax=Haladaptatus halobius TaxID=2884875 RepID=UPI001D09AEC6|nr:sodium:solute symporter family protein [Haladaptatus halobius]
MATNISWMYLGWFVLYLLIVLGIGVWGWRNVDGISDFATTDQTLSMPLAWGSLFASFMSALTVIGGIGYASQYGWAFMTLYTTGAMGGMMFLSLTAKKWQNIRVNSLSELMEVRYDSQLLRALTAAVIVFTYAITLIAQLFGIGYIVEGIIGIPMTVGIATVGLFFVAYTILGGMMSVARTDIIQAAVMGVGVLIMAGVLLQRILTDPANTLTQNTELMNIYGGQTPDNLAVFALFLVFGLGIAVHPYYVQRVISAKDVKTARLVPAVNSLAIVLFYLLISVIGIIGAIYLPQQTGDPMAPAIITELVGGVLGAIAMMAILAGVQSTTDSLLHIVGVYTANDIYGPYFADDPDERELLKWSRIFTGIFGVVIVAFSTYQALAGEIALIAVIGAYAWGVIGGSLFVAVAAGLFWKRATKGGALAAVVFGFVGAVFGRQVPLPVHEIILAVALSIAAMVIVSYLTNPTDDRNLAPIFEDVEAKSSISSDD